MKDVRRCEKCGGKWFVSQHGEECPHCKDMKKSMKKSK